MRSSSAGYGRVSSSSEPKEGESTCAGVVSADCDVLSMKNLLMVGEVFQIMRVSLGLPLQSVLTFSLFNVAMYVKIRLLSLTSCWLEGAVEAWQAGGLSTSIEVVIIKDKNNATFVGKS